MLKGIIFIAITATLWGTTGTVVKYLTTSYGIDPFTIGAFRIIIAAFILFCLALFTVKEKIFDITKKSLPLFLIYGITIISFQLFFFSAIDRTMVSSATLIAISTSPIFVAILSRIFLKEKLTSTVIIALFTSIIGTSLLIGLGELKTSFNPSFMIGNLFALAADILEKGSMDRNKCCITCSKCSLLMRSGKESGCPVRDNDIYGSLLRG